MFALTAALVTLRMCPMDNATAKQMLRTPVLESIDRALSKMSGCFGKMVLTRTAQSPRRGVG